MIKKFKDQPHLEIILKKMCEMVKADFKKMDFNKPNWYWEHSWTPKQEQEFMEWMTDYLKNNKEARKEFGITHNKGINESVNWFVLMYGWKIT